MASLEGRTKIFLLGAAHAVGRLVSSWQECSCWTTSGGLAHIGWYTAKPFPKRIESNQGHSRDNASAMRINSQRLTWVGDELVYGRRTLLRIERDGIYPEMWRVRHPDGSLTDIVNRTRAKDVAVSIALRFLEVSESLSEAPPTAPNEFEIGTWKPFWLSLGPVSTYRVERADHAEVSSEGLPAGRVEAGSEPAHSTGGRSAWV
jgi:hypothetical protein